MGEIHCLICLTEESKAFLSKARNLQFSLFSSIHILEVKRIRKRKRLKGEGDIWV